MLVSRADVAEALGEVEPSVSPDMAARYVAWARTQGQTQAQAEGARPHVDAVGVDGAQPKYVF